MGTKKEQSQCGYLLEISSLKQCVFLPPDGDLEVILTSKILAATLSKCPDYTINQFVFENKQQTVNNISCVGIDKDNMRTQGGIDDPGVLR